jgi:BirA family biotin operon repressor/biotin-[acetyl-CoA-carboxylase] ligase
MAPIETWRLGTRHLGRIVRVYDSVGSTNDIALEWAADPAEIGSAVLANEQTAGRGQFGRSWQAPPSAAVLLSVSLVPPPELCRPVILTAWAAVAVAETVRALTNTPARIKWPNDVLLKGRKVAGILIEQKSVTIAGIGLNLNQSTEHFSNAGLPEAGSLASVAGGSYERDDVARRLIAALDAEYDALLCGELPSLESRWLSHVGLLGRQVTVETIEGQKRMGRLRQLTFSKLALEVQNGSVATLTPERVRRLRAEDEEDAS